MSSVMESKHAAKNLSGSVYLISSDGRVISLPLPSTSRQDPLNWDRKTRMLALFSLGFFSTIGLVIVEAASLVMNGLNKEYRPEEMKPFAVDTLISAPTFCMGLGAFIWVPLSLAIGRRPVFVCASLMLFFATLWAGFAKTYPGLFMAVCLIGVAEGFSVSVGLLIIIDMTFIHQRPQAIALIWSLAGFFSLMGLTSVPYMTNHGVEWRNFYLGWAVPAGIACLLVVCFSPETYFKRPAVAFDGHVVVQSATEETILYEAGEEHDAYLGKPLPETTVLSPWKAFFDRIRVRRAAAGTFTAMLRCYPQLLFCFLNPLIFWVAVLNAMVFAGMLFIGETYALNLSTPPYSLSSFYVILVNVSAGVGSLLAWPTAGSLVARICKSLAMRNRGVREAEQYLVGFVLPVLSGAASTLLYGLTIRFHWNYKWIYVAYALNSFSFTGLSIANTLWVTEAFPRWASPAIAVITGGSYMASFGLSFLLYPWIKSQGYLDVGGQLAALQVGTGMVAIPLAFWGKKARQYIYGRWGMSTAGALRPL